MATSLIKPFKVGVGPCAARVAMVPYSTSSDVVEAKLSNQAEFKKITKNNNDGIRFVSLQKRLKITMAARTAMIFENFTFVRVFVQN